MFTLANDEVGGIETLASTYADGEVAPLVTSCKTRRQVRNRMNWVRCLIMNVLGGVCWALVFGAGGYLLGAQMQRVASPFSLSLLILAVGLAAAGFYFFRHHEQELEERVEAAFPGPWPRREACSAHRSS